MMRFDLNPELLDADMTLLLAFADSTNIIQMSSENFHWETWRKTITAMQCSARPMLKGTVLSLKARVFSSTQMLSVREN